MRFLKRKLGPPIMSHQSTSERPSLAELFYAFLHMGLTGFGGVLPHSRRILVEKKRWLTGDEFTEILSLCHFLPGGNIINMSIAVGQRFYGAAGSLAAFVGLMMGPLAIAIGLAVIYETHKADPLVERAFAGLAAAAAGMLISTALNIAWPLRIRPVAIGIMAICILAIAIFRLPLVAVILVIAPLGIFMTWRSAR